MAKNYFMVIQIEENLSKMRKILSNLINIFIFATITSNFNKFIISCIQLSERKIDRFERVYSLENHFLSSEMTMIQMLISKVLEKDYEVKDDDIRMLCFILERVMIQKKKTNYNTVYWYSRQGR